MEVDSTEYADPAPLEVEEAMQLEEVNNTNASSAMVVAPTFPERDSNALIALQELFPAATEAPVALIEDLDERASSRCLLIWNLPVYYLWENVIRWTKGVLQRIGNPKLERIVRTNESGFQIFWLKFRTPEAAQRFRGLIYGHLLQIDGTRVYCDFIDQNDYNGANGRSSDYWSPQGLSHGRAITDAFSNEYTTPMDAAPSLLARLTMTLDASPEVPLVARLSK